jgi:hypothetical protein
MPQESGTFHAAARYGFAFTAAAEAELTRLVAGGPALWNTVRENQSRFYCSSSGRELIERIHPHHVHV